MESRVFFFFEGEGNSIKDGFSVTSSQASLLFALECGSGHVHMLIKADDMEISRLTPDTPGLPRRPQVPGYGYKMVPSNPILQRHAPSLRETFYKIS